MNRIYGPQPYYPHQPNDLMGKPIVHIEVAGSDGPKLESFYGSLFGWEFDHRGEGDMQYGFMKDGTAGPIGGGVRHEPNGTSEVVFYVEVDDLATAVEQAEALGAKVRIAPIETGEVTFAMITDPLGNPVGLIQK